MSESTAMADYLSEQYDHWCKTPHPTQAHMGTLRRLAESCEVGPIVEFGVQHARSTVALLMGASVPVIGYDIKVTDAAWKLAAERRDWQVYQANTLTIPPVKCEMLFVDSLHTYAQVRGELERHADGVSRLLVFHDTTTYGCIGSNEEANGGWGWTPERSHEVPSQHYGIRMAIDELMVRDPSWRLVEAHHEGHGLLVLERK